MHLISQCLETSCALSVSTLRNTVSPNARLMSAYSGAMRWHGPHHVAVKSATNTCSQGLTLVRFSTQLEPFLTQQHTLNTP